MGRRGTDRQAGVSQPFSPLHRFVGWWEQHAESEPGRRAEGSPAAGGLGEPVGDRPQHRRVVPEPEVATVNGDVLAGGTDRLQTRAEADGYRHAWGEALNRLKAAVEAR